MGTGAKVGIVGLMIGLCALSLAIEAEIGRDDEQGALLPRLLRLPTPPALTVPARARATRAAGEETGDEDGGARGSHAPSVRTYIVQPGDTLGGIARRFYGRSARWRTIYDANRDVVPDPHRLRPDVRLRIPRMDRP